MSDTLLESELFGHERGAFTGAVHVHRGKFETAHTGPLFLDEIADMSPLAQAKILGAVEYGEFERVGGERLHRSGRPYYLRNELLVARTYRRRKFREDQPTKHLSGRTRAEKTLAAAQIRLDDLIPKKDAKVGGRIVFGANFAKTSTERTINMKEKSSKQSKKDKPAVKIKDLKPTKDAKGGAVYQPHGLRDPSAA
jgi:hypothetical protein